MKQYTIDLDEAHSKALEDMAQELELTPNQLLTQALRLYQAEHMLGIRPLSEVRLFETS